VDGDDVEGVAVRPHEGVKEVYLSSDPTSDGTGNATTTHEATYFVEAPSSSGSYAFGPAQVRAQDATNWVGVDSTEDTNHVVGAGTEF